MRSPPPQLAIPLNETKDAGTSLVKCSDLLRVQPAPKQERNCPVDSTGLCWQVFLPGRGELEEGCASVSDWFQQGKGGGGSEWGESFGQSSSKKTEQLETAGCNFSDP